MTTNIVAHFGDDNYLVNEDKHDGARTLSCTRDALQAKCFPLRDDDPVVVVVAIDYDDDDDYVE